MSIILNGFPYWDDFSEQKGFHRILFKPGFGVQTRELNQLQTILQNQIDKFGKHIFKEGSLVLGGQFNIETNIGYINIRNFESSFNETVHHLKGQTIVGHTTGIRAYVVAVEEITVTSATLYVRYLNSSTELEVDVFQGNEQLRICNNVSCTSTNEDILFEVDTLHPSGVGSIFSIDEGVIFTNGHFVWFERQIIPLGRTTKPSYIVGFSIDIEIITNHQDISLLDNAQGAYNFLAPGADRLKIDATLTKLDLPEDISDVTSTEDFALLFIMVNGDIQQIKDTPQYSEIYNELAKRTYDQAGDYVVNGLSVIVREHLNTGENLGYLTLEEGGDVNKLVYGVGGGLAYVKGHEVNNRSTIYLPVPKSMTFENVNNEQVTAVTGYYILINEVVGMPPLDKGTLVNLYDDKPTNIAGGRHKGISSVGALIGAAYVKEMQYMSGERGTGSGTYRLYLYGIQMNESHSFADVRSVYVSGEFVADTVLPVTILESSQEPMLFPLGSEAVRSITDENGDSDTTFIFRRTQPVSIPGGGTISINVATSTDGETHDYGNSGFLTLSLKDSIIVTDGEGKHVRPQDYEAEVIDNTQININIDMSAHGTYSSGPGNVTYNVVRTLGEEGRKQLRTRRWVAINGTTTSRTVNLGISDVYRIRRVLQKTGSPFDSGQELADGEDITILTQFDNGQRDSFYDHATLTLPAPQASDQYTLVELDYFHHDFAQGVGYFSVDSYPIDDEGIEVDHIKTYEIPVYKSPVNGNEYNLRNHLDFRTVKLNTAVDSTNPFDTITANPPTTHDFLMRGEGGLRTAASGSRIRLDYSFYLARRDVIVVDKESNYEVIKGVPAVNPITPRISENVMGIARVFVPPYPSIATTYAREIGIPSRGVSVQEITHARHTMREIGTLKRRIETLEYYNALSLLEKSAIDMLITDENGLDRFKNGFFVDGFMDHSLGATYLPDYNVAIDREEQSIRPFFDMNAYMYKVKTSTPGTKTTGPLTTLNYNEVVLLEQMNVTTTRNIEQSVFRFVGTLSTTPDSDIWVDTKTVDTKTVEFGECPTPTPTGAFRSTLSRLRRMAREAAEARQYPNCLRDTMFVNWNSWENHVLGHNVYARKRGDRSGNVAKARGLIGTFDNFAQAASAGGKRTLIETLTQEQRTGIQTNVNYQKETQELGDRVIDISIEPYIRPQTITVKALGVKARTRYHIFFDGENMNQYLTPLNPISGNKESGVTEGSEWRANEYGELLGRLRLPATGKRFRIGNKEIKITDSPTNAPDATSYAEGSFFAHGMVQQKQNTILSTKTPVITQTEVVQKKRVVQTTQVMGPSCMAYSFKPEVPEGEVGCFLTSVDVWISDVHPTLGVWFEIREMDNAGNITRNQVPYSEVWYTSADINPHTTGGTFDRNKFFTVQFPAPLFLYNDTEYAFVIHTEGLNPDTYFWISRLGETNLITGKQVTGRQLTGNVYTTNNNMNWDMVPDIDLMVRFKRANFTSSSASFTLVNDAYEFITVNANILKMFDRFGEEIVGSQNLTLTQVQGGAPEVGDYISQGGYSAEVVSIQGNKYMTKGFEFTSGNVIFLDSTEIPKGITATVTEIEQGSGKLYRSNEDIGTIELQHSNGKFFTNGQLRYKEDIEEPELAGEQVKQIFANIVSLDDWKFSTIHVTPNHLVLNRTSCVFEQRARRSSNGTMPSSWAVIDPDENISFPIEHAILSRSREVSNWGGAESSELRITLNSESEFVSPVVDLNRINALYVHNIINDDDTGEDGSSGGELLNRYISKIVTLADGQDAEDLFVAISAYQPPNSEVKVWFKVRNAEDAQPIENKEWIEMVPRGNPVSSLVDNNDFKEITFDVPSSNKDMGGVLVYTANGAEFVGFKQFMVKIGLMGTNSAIPPRVADLRAIALQL